MSDKGQRNELLIHHKGWYVQRTPHLHVES